MSLFQAQVSEKLIQQRIHMGHKILKVLRQYERTSDCQLLDVSNIASNFCEINATSTVSVESTVLTSMPLSTIAEPPRCTAVVCPQLSTPVSQSMARKQGPSVLLHGCSYSNCIISFSGNPIATCEKENRRSLSDVDMTKLLEGISVHKLFD